MNEEELHLRGRKWSLKSSPVIAAAGLVLIVATAYARQAGASPTSKTTPLRRTRRITRRLPKWGLLGGIFTYQHSFGKGGGPITQEATFQTLFHYNFRRGLYLQSEGTTIINSGSGVRAVPIGLGMGKVWTYVSGGTFSAFLEPQYSVWRRGVGAPTWQLYSGISVQIPVAFKLWSK
jgi:hypothetical protein